MERAATQTTLTGWVLASSDARSPLVAGCMDNTEEPDIHDNYVMRNRERTTEGPRPRSSTTKVDSNSINDKVNAQMIQTGDTTYDNNHIGNRGGHYHGEKFKSPLPPSGESSPTINTIKKVKAANKTSTPSKPLTATYGEATDGVISFEHINVNGINPHSDFVELTHTMGSLEAMGASVYSLNETKWDTTCPTFCKYIKHIIKRKDQHAKVVFSSNEEEKFKGTWKPGGHSAWSVRCMGQPGRKIWH